MTEAKVFWMHDPESARFIGTSPFVRQPAYSMALDRIRALEAALQKLIEDAQDFHPTSPAMNALALEEARVVLRSAQETKDDQNT